MTLPSLIEVATYEILLYLDFHWQSLESLRNLTHDSALPIPQEFRGEMPVALIRFTDVWTSMSLAAISLNACLAQTKT